MGTEAVAGPEPAAGMEPAAGTEAVAGPEPVAGMERGPGMQPRPDTRKADIKPFSHTGLRKKPVTCVLFTATASFTNTPIFHRLRRVSLLICGSDYGPVYDYRFWQDLAMKVQSELARLGYYRGAIDGVIGSGSRQPIRGFQRRKGYL